MTPFKLTFNKPAVRQFIEGEETAGLRIKIENGAVMFSPISKVDGPDSTELRQRTRGGFEAVIEGDGAQAVFDSLLNPAGPFFVLKRVSKDWVAAVPFSGKDAPPKFEPHVRVWSPTLPKAEKVTVEKPSRRAKVSVARHAEPQSFVDRMSAVYAKLAETPRPGRPSRELMEARETKEAFERMAVEFVANRADGIGLKGMIATYNQIGEYLRTVCPEALHVSAPAAPVEAKKPKLPRAKAKTEKRAKRARAVKAPVTAAAPAPAAPTSAAPPVAAQNDAQPDIAEHHPSDDETSEQQVRQALDKLGLGEQKPTIARRTRGKLHLRAFNGEGLISA